MEKEGNISLVWLQEQGVAASQHQFFIKKSTMRIRITYAFGSLVIDKIITLLYFGDLMLQVSLLRALRYDLCPAMDTVSPFFVNLSYMMVLFHHHSCRLDYVFK